jgi:hypothetical protein
MISTSTPIAADFAKEIINATEEGAKQGARMLWDIVLEILKAHPLAVTLILLAIIAIAMVKFMLGRWGMLGSVLYNFFYFGTLLAIGLIWGPGVFVSDFFSAACTLILYPICYFAVGIILDWIGVRRSKMTH